MNSGVIRRRAENQRRNGSDLSTQSGFTLIELLVVMLILGILIGIAIPVFISTINAAKTSSAEIDIANGLMFVRALYVDNQGGNAGSIGYGTTAQAVAALNAGAAGSPNATPITFTANPVGIGGPAHQISVLTGSTLNDGYYDWIVLAIYSNDYNCLDMFDNTAYSTSSLSPGTGVWYGVEANMTSCSPIAPPWTAVIANFRFQGNSFPPI
jgi:prepilin-type N-terminal cleavage/methylation domain-containing protein